MKVTLDKYGLRPLLKSLLLLQDIESLSGHYLDISIISMLKLRH